jgi:hypothetical protein
VLDADGRAEEVRALSRILVLGGYGGFGARLTRRLAGRGHTVLVAGRSLAKARAFCTMLEHAEPVVADRNGDLGPLLAQLAPDLVIDAAGPFQDSDYRVPIACIEASIPYVDLADARAFVAGIGALQAQAAAAGVAVIAGASSVPALSGAAARRLAAGLSRVCSVEIAISTSRRSTLGASVVAAILSYAGRPIRLWRGRRWDHGFGWQELRRHDFALSDGARMKNRWLALADVPDLDLLPASLPGRPAVVFHAGNESALQTLGLWLLTWPVRWFGVSIRRLAPALSWMQRLMQKLSEDRSAMIVRLKGEVLDSFVERQWILIAENGDGPEIPTLATVIVAEEILAGRVVAGARPADQILALAAFEPLFSTLSLRHEVRELLLPQPLYARVMQRRFAVLPAAVRRMHWVCGDSGASGEVTVARSRNPLANLVALVMGFPRAGSHSLHVSFFERDGVECWTRHFGDRSFSSHLSEQAGQLVERFGVLRFVFDLPSDDVGLTMRIRRWSLFGLPLPLWLAPRSAAREWEEDGRFCFDVPISLPLIGLVVHYAGWLSPDGG